MWSLPVRVDANLMAHYQSIKGAMKVKAIDWLKTKPVYMKRMISDFNRSKQLLCSFFPSPVLITRMPQKGRKIYNKLV